MQNKNIVLIFGMILLFVYLSISATANERQEFVYNNHKISNLDKKAMLDHMSLDESKIPVIVKLQNPNQYNTIISNLPRNSFRLKRSFDIGFSGNISFDGLKSLSENPSVERIYYNFRTIEFLQESVPLINSNKVWSQFIGNYSLDGSEQTICVVDTGINYTYPQLGNCTQSQFLNGTCSKVIGGYDFVSNDNNPADEVGHGTVVAAIVSANGSLNGVAKNSKLVALRGVGGQVDDARLAMNWCIDNRDTYKIKVMTLSFGVLDSNNKTIFFNSICDGLELLADAANNATRFGIFVDAASGNDGNKTGIASPSCGSNVTSVGASYDYAPIASPFNSCNETQVGLDSVACATNRDNLLDTLAPGALITIPGDFCPPGCGCFDNQIVCVGTSLAAPHVAGVAALMFQAANISGQSLTPAQIELIMKRTGIPIYDSATGLTFPRIDAYKAVMAVLYDVFVSDLKEIYSDNQGRKIFEFQIFNDFHSNVTVNWTLDTGDGNTIESSNFVMNPLTESNSTLVVIDYTYGNIGTYNVTARIKSSNGTVANQTIQVSVTKPNLRVSNFTIQHSSGTRRIFEFWLQNNASVAYSNITFQINVTGEPSLNSTQDITLAANETMFAFIEYIYQQTGQHNVTVTADYLNVHNEFNETDNTAVIFD